MTTPDLDQFDLLARTDDLTARVRDWVEDDVPWEPAGRVRALLRRVFERVETLRVRIESPLVVATFGGTGVGKSALVNAIVGREVTRSSREQRPTTKRPVLVVHPDVEPEALGLPLAMLDVVRADAELLRDVAIVDCPDPDTSEAAAAGSNLALLRAIVPHCDVLIVAATQEKYRSARVHEELRDAAAGCRLLFVQTHADADADVRDDWRRLLVGQGYEVPELFFVDSRQAFEEQKAGRVLTGDAGRLLGVLRTELAAAERTRIRRANVLDLLSAALDRGRVILEPHGPAVETLEEKLAEQRAGLTTALADGLRDELLRSRNLWERRLLSAVTANWGFSPFSSVLRLYNGLGGVLASMTLYRARSAAQVALIGAAEGVRRLQSWQEERDAQDRVGRIRGVPARRDPSRTVAERDPRLRPRGGAVGDHAAGGRPRRPAGRRGRGRGPVPRQRDAEGGRPDHRPRGPELAMARPTVLRDAVRRVPRVRAVPRRQEFLLRQLPARDDRGRARRRVAAAGRVLHLGGRVSRTVVGAAGDRLHAAVAAGAARDGSAT